jgi:hypothetical protein
LEEFAILARRISCACQLSEKGGMRLLISALFEFDFDPLSGKNQMLK